MSVNAKSTPVKSVASVRLEPARRMMLQEIGRERGHDDLSDTLRDAVDEYIARYLRSKAEAVA